MPVILNFWQNMLSPHQSACLRALASLGHDVHLIVDQEVLPERRVMGWARPDFGAARITVAPTPGEIAAIVAANPPDACHIISGLRGARLSAAAFTHCRARGARIGMLCEPADPRGWKGLVRRGMYAWEALRWGHAVDFILAMGQTGVDWYTASGYGPGKVFHFGYVMETPVLDGWPPPSNAALRIVYAGSLIQLKGIDLLLRALGRLTATPWRLDLIGDGPEHASLQQMAHATGIADRITFLGMLSMPEVTHQLMRADVLVLPSRGDGWGAVVSEALMCGIPAICSDQCGAADLLRESWRGAVFRSESVDGLTQALARHIQQGPLTGSMRNRIRAWSRCLEGPSMAAYLLAVMNHVYAHTPRPVPPWHTDECPVRQGAVENGGDVEK